MSDNNVTREKMILDLKEKSVWMHLTNGRNLFSPLRIELRDATSLTLSASAPNAEKLSHGLISEMITSECKHIMALLLKSFMNMSGNWEGIQYTPPTISFFWTHLFKIQQKNVWKVISLDSFCQKEHIVIQCKWKEDASLNEFSRRNIAQSSVNLKFHPTPHTIFSLEEDSYLKLSCHVLFEHAFVTMSCISQTKSHYSRSTISNRVSLSMLACGNATSGIATTDICSSKCAIQHWSATHWVWNG